MPAPVHPPQLQLPRLQLLVGPARCGKTQRLLGLYHRTLGHRELRSPSIDRCCWLAPNQTTVAQLYDRLLEQPTDAGSGVAFLQPNLHTFASFAESLIAEKPWTGSERPLRAISSTQKRRLLQHVIRTALEQRKLEHFSRVASTPGFVIQVDEFIAELKRTDVWPEAYQQWCQQRPRSDRRSRELSHLYTAYQQLLHRGELYDGEGRFWAAREILAAAVSAASVPTAASSTAAARPRFDLVVVNGFNDFTTAQYDILRLLGASCSRLVISLTYETASEEVGGKVGGALWFAKPSRTRARLQEIFPQLEIEPAESKAESGRGKAESLQGEVASVEILAANSEVGEVEAIAERVKALLLGGRSQRATQPQSIVVVPRGGESTAALIEAVFPDYGIPFASELRPRLEAEPLIRALQTLLRLHQEDWPFQTLLEVINNRLFTKFDATNGLASDGFANRLSPRAAIEHCLRSAQLPNGKAALLEQLEYQRDVAAVGEGGETDRRGAEVAIALGELRQLDTLFSALPSEATLDVWALALETLLGQLGALTSTVRAAVAWKQLRRSWREIERVDAWGPTQKEGLTLTELQELIVTIARTQQVPATHDAIGRVRILSAESARKLSTKHLFILGLSEHAFSNAGSSSDGSASAPSEPSTTTEDAELLAANLPEENMLEEVSPEEVTTEEGSAPAEPSVRRSDAMLLFYELVTRPTESLTLSYPALDTKGQPLSPSPLLTDLERKVGDGRITRSTMSLGQGVDLDATPHSSSSFRRQAVVQALEGKPRWLAGMISHPDYVRAGSSILGGIDCIAERSVRDSFGPHEGLLLSGEAQARLAERYDAKHLWSPSRLEGYAACPFRYFAEQILRLEPLGELTLRNDPRRRGSLLHQVLATIHEQLSGEALDETAGDSTEAVDLVQRFLGTLAAAVKASPLRGISQSLREIERREIEAWAPSYAEQETSYRSQWKHLDEPPRPAHFEVRFGSETRPSEGEVADRASTTVPFELELGDERICLTGAIDRVDIGHLGGVTVFNIIDYKSGKAVKLSLDKVRSGHQLQLPLYALAAEQLLFADQGAVALATGYWNIQGKGFDGKRGGSLQLRELADQTLKTSEDWEKLQPEIMARVQELITGIRAGQFPVYNEEEHCTRSCSLSTVCRVGQIRSLEKVWPPVEEVKADRSGDGS